jgi:hypothetical protein
MEAVRKLDRGSLLVMAITMVLFVGAVFATGLTHDLLLEAGVFLVSVKLMIMAYKNSVTAESIRSQLDEIKSLLMARPPDQSADAAGKDAPRGR